MDSPPSASGRRQAGSVPPWSVLGAELGFGMSSPPSVAADEDMIDELISSRPTSPFTSPTTIVKKGRRKRDETVSSVKPRKPISGSLTVQKRVSSSNLFGPFLEGQTTFSFSPASGSQSISPRAKKSKDPSKGINQASSSPQKKPRSISANKKGIPSPSRRPPQLCSGAAHDVDEPALHDFIPLKLSPVEGFESSVKVEEEDTRVSKSKEGKRARKSNASLPLIKDRGKLKLSATAPIITKPGRRGLDPGPPSRTQIPPSSLSPTSMDNIHSPEYVSKKRMKAQTLPSTAPGTLRSTSAKRPSFSSKSGKRRKSESNHAVIEISSDDDGPRPLKKRRTNLIVLSDEDGPNVTAVPHAPAELDDSISSPPGQTFDFDMGHASSDTDDDAIPGPPPPLIRVFSRGPPFEPLLAQEKLEDGEAPINQAETRSDAATIHTMSERLASQSLLDEVQRTPVPIPSQSQRHDPPIFASLSPPGLLDETHSDDQMGTRSDVQLYVPPGIPEQNIGRGPQTIPLTPPRFPNSHTIGFGRQDTDGGSSSANLVQVQRGGSVPAPGKLFSCAFAQSLLSSDSIIMVDNGNGKTASMSKDPKDYDMDGEAMDGEFGADDAESDDTLSLELSPEPEYLAASMARALLDRLAQRIG